MNLSAVLKQKRVTAGSLWVVQGCSGMFCFVLPPNPVPADQNPGDSDSAKYNDTALSLKQNTTQSVGKRKGGGGGGGCRGETAICYADT